VTGQFRSRRKQLAKAMTNEEIINYLLSDTAMFIDEKEGLDINDSFGDYLEGLINRSQSVLRMMGVPEEQIPTDGSC
jgi:phosphoribosylformylglycinamidine (FGAM) synthase-like amidotransferase family enzyme